MSLSNVSSQCPISSPLTLPLDSCCRTIACFFCSNVWKYISAICIIRSLHCSFYRKLSVCSFQGTNCDNHSIMVIYGLKWLFLHIESYPFTLWAQVDSNHRPHAYQACALTSWAISPFSLVLTLDKQIWSRQPPALPHRLQCSTIGRLGLNRRVRDGYGCFP